MTRKNIPVEVTFRKWEKDPKFRAAYDALEDEFALAAALIKARGEADMTQEQIAVAMGTTQAVVAALKVGGSCHRRATLNVLPRRPVLAYASASSSKSTDRSRRRDEERQAAHTCYR